MRKIAVEIWKFLLPPPVSTQWDFSCPNSSLQNYSFSISVRSQVLAEYGSRCEQRRIMVDMLQEADEVFICNSVRGIVPITAIDDQEYGIGPVTRELQTWLLDGTRRA